MYYTLQVYKIDMLPLNFFSYLNQNSFEIQYKQE